MIRVSNNQLLEIASNVIDIEAAGVKGLVDLLDENFCKIVDAIINMKGKLIVSGMGKSGIIGKKIAATLASTGTSSFFMHPGEAFHGDLGMVTKDDILLMLSYSGETEEIIRLLPYAKTNSIFVASISGDPRSTLAKNSNNHICVRVKNEACPLQLAPTSSTTATLVMGDALAVALMKQRDFKPENFAEYHPGGSLGKKLLLKVKDRMHSKNLPVIQKSSSFIDLVECMTIGGLGVVVIQDENELTQGVVSSGDMLRAMKSQKYYLNICVNDMMTLAPVTVNENISIEQAEFLMKQKEITTLLVNDGII